MVASDTVVGLVGAGILLVALVGVFVYESQQGGIETPELADAHYETTRSGTITTTAQTGQAAPVTGACQPPACTPASTSVNLEITGLPDVGGLKYVVFLTGSGSPYNAGALGKSGEKWTISNSASGVDNSGKNTVVVSLEKTTSATSPGWPIMTFATSAASGSGMAMFIESSGNHTLSLTPSGNQLNVSAMIDDVPDKSGYEYHGWLKTETADGVTYTHVGKFGHPTGADEHAMGKEDLVLAMNVNGTANDYNEFWVTIEASGSMPGTTPGGPAVIKAAYNKYEPSGAEA
jgi:hypothetical protein